MGPLSSKPHTGVGPHTRYLMRSDLVAIPATNDVLSTRDGLVTHCSQSLFDDQRDLVIDADSHLLFRVIGRHASQLPRNRVQSDLLSEPRLVALPVVFQDLRALGANFLDQPAV